MSRSKKTPQQKPTSSRKDPQKVLAMQIADVFIASSAKQRTYIEQLNFAPRNFTQKHLGTICGFFMVRDKSSWSAHIVHFLNAEFKKEYFSQSKRSLNESFTAALHHTNRALAELAKNDNINWIGMLDSVLCAYDDKTIHFSVTGSGAILLMRDGELVDISEGLSPAEDAPNPLKTFIDTASGDLIAGDKLILTSRQLLDLVPFEELAKNLERFDDDEFFQFVTTVLTNECPMASTQIITVSEKNSNDSKVIKKSRGSLSDTDSSTQENPSDDQEIIIPQNAFSAKQYPTKKEPHYIPDGSLEEKKDKPVAAKRNTVTKKTDDATAEPDKAKTGEYIDKRTGHIYVSGDTPEQSHSALGPYLDTGKDYLADGLYYIKKWGRSLGQKISYMSSQVPILLSAITSKAKGLRDNRNHTSNTKSVREVISDIPDDLPLEGASDIVKKQGKLSDSSSEVQTNSSDTQTIFSKDYLIGLRRTIKERIRNLNLRSSINIVVKDVQKWATSTRTRLISYLPPSIRGKIAQTPLDKEPAQQTSPKAITKKKLSLPKKDVVPTPQADLKKTSVTHTKEKLVLKEQSKQKKTLSVREANSDSHFSALDDLYGNEYQEVEAKRDGGSVVAILMGFVSTLIASLLPVWKKIKAFILQMRKKDSHPPLASTEIDADGFVIKETSVTNANDPFSAWVARSFPQLAPKLLRVKHYIHTWEIGNIIIKILIGIVFIALVVYPLYKKITQGRADREAVVIQEEKVFEENLSDTVQEELTIPEPTKTVADPNILSEQGGASHSFLFKDQAYFATDTSLLSLADESLTTIPLPKNSGSLAHIIPIEDLNLIIFLTDTNVLYAYNPTTQIFNKQTITTPLDHTKVLSLGSYQQKFYVGSNEGITRFDRSIGGFDSATPWVKDATPISGLTSLTVDGNLYVTKDDRVLAFEGGLLLDVSSPDNIKTQLAYKTQQMDDLWIVDKVNFTIHKLNPQTLSIEESFVHEDLRDVVSFSVDEKNTTAYFTTDKTIKSLSLVNTQ